jgi:hypothetical protein
LCPDGKFTHREVPTIPAPTAKCQGNVAVSGSSGSIGDGPGQYHNKMDCAWHIQVASGKAALKFSQLDLETNFDYVHIYDGSSSSASLIGAYTGQTVPTTIVGKTSDLFVHFTSDYSNVKAGFVATWFGSSGAKTCVVCEAGKYSQAGFPGCQPCVAGKFAAASGTGQCTNCPAGKYSSAVSSTVCV